MNNKPIPTPFFTSIGILCVMVMIAYFVANEIFKFSFLYGILFISSGIGLVVIPNLIFYYKLTRDEQPNLREDKQ